MTFAEYIWLDGNRPMQGLRSKTRIVSLDKNTHTALHFPIWNFDGKSTGQAERSGPDCILHPACVAKDPFRGGSHYLVLCEVLNADGTDHATNTRSLLRSVLERGANKHDAWGGFAQEFTLAPEGSPPGARGQGVRTGRRSSYCGIGGDRSFARLVAEAHAVACQTAGLMFHGIKGEASPGSWEFQVGHRGIKNDDPSLLNACDHLWLARYLLQRIAEMAGASVSFVGKSVPGKRSGLVLGATFSSAEMRVEHGLQAIRKAIRRLRNRHEEHMLLYGHGQLAGVDDAQFIRTGRPFSSGSRGRRASVRIPSAVALRGAGHFEDRRPGGDADPYLVAAGIAATVFDVPDNPIGRFVSTVSTRPAGNLDSRPDED